MLGLRTEIKKDMRNNPYKVVSLTLEFSVALSEGMHAVRFLMGIQIYFSVRKERQNNQHLSLKIMLLSLCQAFSWYKTSDSSP